MPSRLLSYRDETLCVESRPLDQIARDTATPFFLFSESHIRDNYDALVKGLSSDGGLPVIRYCAKTNHESALLRRIAELGAHCLVSHGAEAEKALQHGFTPERLAYQRPVLLPDEVRGVFKAGITVVHLFRKADLDSLERVASEIGPSINVSLRLKHPTSRVNLSPVRWLSGRLGLSDSEVIGVAQRMQDSAHLRLTGLNVYIGTQQTSDAGFRRAVRHLVTMAGMLWQRIGLRIEELNLGGGIPSPSLGTRWKHRSQAKDMAENALVLLNQAPDALESHAKHLGNVFGEEVRRAGLDWMPSLAIEPGRALVGNAGMLISRVMAVQGRWLFLDASQNYLGESPLVAQRMILPIRPRIGAEIRRYHLSGSTLNTMDVIDLWRTMPAVDVGDCLVICDAGAYSIGRACRYGSLLPAVYLVHEGGPLGLIRGAEREES